MISSGSHEMSFKRYFVRNVLNLNKTDLSDNIYQSDTLLNEFLINNEYQGYFSTEDYEDCFWSPFKYQAVNEIFPKNVTNKSLNYQKVIIPITSDSSLKSYEKYIINSNRITLILQDPLERAVFIFYNLFIKREYLTNNEINELRNKVLETLNVSSEDLSFNYFIEKYETIIDYFQVTHDNTNLSSYFLPQTLTDEFLKEKIEGLSNLLIIVEHEIDKIFPGYNSYKTDYLENLTTPQRLCAIPGVYDLNNLAASLITKNHIRSGSFVSDIHNKFGHLFKNDIETYNQYKDLYNKTLIDTTIKQTFVVGSVRSGTSFVCDMLGKYLKDPSLCFNETGQRYYILRWKLRNSSFCFKYCEDLHIIPELSAMFPNAVFVYVVRDIRDIMYTITNASAKSWPYKDLQHFPAINDIVETKKCSLITATASFLESQFKMKDHIFNEYKERIILARYEDLLDSHKLLSFLRMFYPNKTRFENETSIQKHIKPVNHNNWHKFSSVEKKILFTNDFIVDHLIKFNYVTDEEIQEEQNEIFQDDYMDNFYETLQY